MGLGKTLQALSIAYYYKNEWPLLIVCPSSMRFPWIEEIEKWLPDIEPHELNLVQSGTDASNIKTSKISIVGYGLLSHSSSRLLINCLKEMRFGMVIVDESHYMKNRKAARTKALVSVIKQAKRAVLLTGTPALARPEELYVQIDVLKPDLVGSFSRFANRYCEAHTEYVCGGKIRKWNTQGASNLEELHNVLKSNVMIRRLKRNVLTQLPPKRRQRITFHLAESECKKQMADVIEEFRSVCKQIKATSSSQSHSQMDKNPLFEMKRLATVLYKQTGLSKITAVRQYIADILDNTDKKFLVFAHHIDVMKAIEQELIKKKVKYIRIAGDVSSVIRGSLVHQFQTDSTTRVAILSILAASMGITLTAADHIIFSELHWTPGVMEQAEDRVHRIGQENSVLVQYLVAKGTIDEVLWRMLCNKIYVTTTTLNGKLQGLDVEEGSEKQSKLLEAFSAWVMEDEDEEMSDEEFLFTHSQKKRKQDSLQRSIIEFFHSPSTSKCRKTDSGKEWCDIQDSSSEEDQQYDVGEMKIETTPEPEPCIIEDNDEDNVLRKTAKKTYKLAGKKKPPNTAREAAQTATTAPASESQEMALELAHEIINIDTDDIGQPASGTVVNMLSSYTRLLNKSKRKHNGKCEKVCEQNKINGLVESLVDSQSKGGSNCTENNEEEIQIEADDEERFDGDRPNERNTFPHEIEASNDIKDNISANSDFCRNTDVTSTEERYKILHLKTSNCLTTGRRCDSSEVSEVNEYDRPLDLQSPGIEQEGNTVSSTTDGAHINLNGNGVRDSQNKDEAVRERVPSLNDSIDSKPLSGLSDSTVLKTPEFEQKANCLKSEDDQIKRLPIAPSSSEDIKDFKNPGTWCCSLCTFDNSAFLRTCEICDTPRYRSRRKSTNKKLCTDEFVKRKQQKILENCSGNENRSSGKNATKRPKGKKGLVAVTRGIDGSNSAPVSKDRCSKRDTVEESRVIEKPSATSLSSEKYSVPDEIAKSFEDELEDIKGLGTVVRDTRESCVSAVDRFVPIGTVNSSKDKLKVVNASEMIARDSEERSVSMEDCSFTEVKAKCSDITSDCSEVTAELQNSTKLLDDRTKTKDQVLVDKPEILDKLVESRELITSDEDLFSAAPLNEFSDEIMTSPSEDDTDNTVENLFGPGSEFDDITDDDWWICESCKNCNYDDAAEKCESCGLKKSKSRDHVEDLVTDLDDDDCWRCEDCGEFNFGDEVIKKCTKCCHGGKKNRKSLVEQYKNLRHLIVDDEGSEGHIGKVEVVENLMFRLSNYTDRVYLYDGDGDPLNCNVNILDMDDSSAENIPAILTEISNRKQVVRFARKWKSLQQRNRRMIRKAGIIFDDPYEAIDALKTGRDQKICTIRFPSKEKLRAEVLEAAQEKNGTVRHCAKPKGRLNRGGKSVEERMHASESASTTAADDNQRRWIQAVDENGQPLCLFCKGPVDTKNTDCLWDERFCSHKCKEQYQCRISGTRVRHQLFQDEKGVCQKCGCDAHELYRQIKLLSKTDRRSYLENTPFISLPVTLLNKIIVDPKEGMFWEADHVVAVVEGGGECDLENYRTLCVPCHRQVTAELRERLKVTRRKPRMAGIPDITSFFS